MQLLRGVTDAIRAAGPVSRLCAPLQRLELLLLQAVLLERAGFAPACGSLRDGVSIKSRPLSVRIANVHELRIEKETGCYLDYLYAICA